jgi:hypothetical protein
MDGIDQADGDLIITKCVDSYNQPRVERGGGKRVCMGCYHICR